MAQITEEQYEAAMKAAKTVNTIISDAEPCDVWDIYQQALNDKEMIEIMAKQRAIDFLLYYR